MPIMALGTGHQLRGWGVGGYKTGGGVGGGGVHACEVLRPRKGGWKKF